MPIAVLHLVDVSADMRQRYLVVGQRQQIVEEDAVMRGPGEMLGEQRRLIDIDQAS